MAENYFLRVIQLLRKQEEILLYNNILKISTEDEAAAGYFLQKEYDRESLAYPHEIPEFNRAAALWGARTVYLAAQLLLYRKNEVKELSTLFLPFVGLVDGAAILSADLCLRFLPGVLVKLAEIDEEDELIKTLETILKKWHYSGIQFLRKEEGLDFSEISTNQCVFQLYSDRVLLFKNKQLAKHPKLKEKIAESLGMYGDQLAKGMIEN